MTTTTTVPTIKLNSTQIAGLNHTFDPQLRPGAIIKLAPEGTERPAAGWYQSNTGDVTMDGDVEFDRMLTIEGLVTHEASHSVWSNWLTMRLILSGEITMPELDVLKTLEEARIEGMAVKTYPGSRPRLRACYGHLLADGFANPAHYTTVAGSVTNWALAWGRIHSGVVDPVELDAIDKLMRDRFGDYPMDVFDDLLGEYTTLRFGNFKEADEGVPKRALRIAREWLELLKSLQDDEGESDVYEDLRRIVEEMLGEESEGVTTKRGEGSGKGEAGKGESSGEGGTGEGDDDPITETGHGDGGEGERFGWADEFVKAADTVASTPTRREDVRRMSPRDRKARIWNKRNPRNSSNWREDDPTPAHARLIVRLAKAFESDASPAVVRTRVRSTLPPGRLNGRGAMMQAADRAGGRMTTVEPWRATKQHRTDRPPVIIGVATDTSGSMASYTDLLGGLAYVTAHASKRVNARFAATTFGVKAEPVIAVGEMPAKIRVRSANSGHEAFDDAMAALDGPLRLTENTIGRKLLIVVSDSQLVRAGEISKAKLWLKALNAAGTHVIWVGAGTGKVDPDNPTGWSWTAPLCQWARDEAKLANVRWVDEITEVDEFVTAIIDNLKGA